MEEDKKRAGGKKGGVKFGCGGGGGGVVVLGGAALVAATLWLVCEFRKSRKPNCKKGSLDDFQIPNLEKVENVDEGGDGLSLILQNPKLPVDVHESWFEDLSKRNFGVVVFSETKEKDVSGEINHSARQHVMDVEILSFGINQDEKIQKDDLSHKIEDDVPVDGTMVMIEKANGVICEADRDSKQEAVEVSGDDSLGVDALTSVSENELRSGSLVDCDVKAIDTPENVADEGVQSVTLSVSIVNDSNDVVSEDLDYEGEDDSDENSGATVDSSGESIFDVVWPAESLEALSQENKVEKNHNSIPNKIVEAGNNRTPSSTNDGKYSLVKDMHHNGSLGYNVNQGLRSTTKGQMMINSTRLRICVSSVVLAMLVLLAALLAQHKYPSYALSNSLSSHEAFLMK